MSIDAAYELANAIINDATANIAHIRSEEDAKLQIITRLLVEGLGWRHADISAESPNENGYSDYILNDGQRNAFAVEAKKLGVLEIATQATSMNFYKISGPVLKGVATGVSQVASYCLPQGIPLSVLTDGIIWIVFLPWVPNAPFRDKQAVVFPGFKAILDDFSTFYELLSREHSAKGTYRVIFDRVHENRLILERSLFAPIAPGDIALVQKSAMAFDLDNVFARFFSGLVGDNDPNLIIDCFVETRESRIADFALERITRNVLGNIDPTERSIDEGLSSIVQSTVEGEQGQSIFIVGPSGAGKSTFLERFFKKTLSAAIRERCVLINVNVLDASGDETVIASWLTEQVIQAIETQTFASGYPEWNDLQGLYQGEYVKRSKGIDAHLYKRSPHEFKEKFAGFVEEQVAKDREGYLSRLLRDLVRNRKKLPIFVVDNTDEFPLSFKIAIFQYLQALRRATEHCLLIFPATDRSAWQFAKTEVFNIYSSRSFFLPTPAPREVFRKRVEYLQSKVKTTQTDTVTGEYFVGRGIRLKVTDLAGFAAVVQNIFVDQDYAAKRVGELSNYNMRKALGLSKRVITSATLRVEDLIRSYLTGELVAPTPERFMNALMKGDYAFYKTGEEPLLFPIFQVDSSIRQSPLLSVRVLSLLRALHQKAAEDAERYMEGQSICAYFGVMAISELAVQRSLDALLSAGLIEPYDMSMKEYADDQRLAITFSGLAHLDLALSNPVYFEQMALTTRIVDADLAQQIKGAFYSSRSTNERMEEVRALFSKFLVEEDARHCSVPSAPEFAMQVAIAADIYAQWNVSKASTAERLAPPPLAASAVIATVDRFDQTRGYGFVDVPELKDQAYLQKSVVDDAGFGDLYDGDEMLCDISRNARGLAVSKIYEIQPPRVAVARGRITRLLEDRHYGFFHIPELGVDAFFHYHVFSPEQQSHLTEGLEMMVEVKTDKLGRSQIRRLAPNGMVQS
jgi:cold shock CspA family protein